MYILIYITAQVVMKKLTACNSLGLTKTGQGARIESFYRAVPSYVVPGGSEDVLIDLGVREALKLHKVAEKAKATKSKL